MNQIFRKSAAVLALTLSLIPVVAHKRGIFSKENLRPEKIEVPSSGSLSIRPQLAEPIPTKNSSFRGFFTDVTNPPFADKKSASGIMKAPQQAPRALGDGTIIYGSLLYSNSWAGTNGNYGIYSFPASQYTAPELVYAQGGYEANGGGCYHNGKYYWNSFVYTQEMGYTFTTFCTYDFNTKEFTKNILSFIDANFDLQQITNALTYDPTTDRIYALANIKVVDETGVIEKYYPAFSEVDPYTGFATPIAQIPSMIALAATQSGEIYAISRGEDACLYRINKNSGDLTLIGSTGISADFAQSMAFDPITGKLYWAAIRANGAAGLYEVNISTGQASLIFNFGNNEEYTGLYIPAPVVEEDAPAKVAEIAPSFVDGSLSGSVSVTAPSQTFSGAKLSGKITLSFICDNGEAVTREVAPGEKVEFPLTLTEGIHSFTAFASNAAGEGPRTAKATYVGIDAPAAVENLKLTATDDGKAHIRWSAPTSGRNDGYIDPSQITYNVTRYPDKVVVAKNITATYFTDPVDEDADNYWFEVTPFCGGREGISASTETGIFGNGTDLPCHFSLKSKEEFDLFTVIDANKDWDGQYKWGGWMFGGDFAYTKEEDGDCAVYGYHPENAADDWLITPPVYVEKGKKYRLTFTMWTRGDKETIEVTAGPQNTIEAQTVILPKATYNHKDHKVFDVDFTAATDGNYYIGYHITSEKKRFYAFVSDIKVDIVPDTDSPEAVGSLVATPGADGAEEATLSFTAPSKDLGGNALSAIDKIEIFHGVETTPVATLQATPGQQLSWTEKNMKGFVDYRIVPYANGKAGKKSETTIFVGWDVPVAIEDAKVSDASGKPVIIWTAPTVGVNGGYINPEKLTYSIYRYEDNLQLLQKDFSGTSFTDETLTTTPQHLVAYVVMPQSPAGYGEPASTDYIVYGDPLEGEFIETFADAAVHSTPWVMYRIKGKVQNWGITSYGSSPYCYPADDDGGMAVYGTDGYVGDEGLLVSPKLDISDLPNPILSFWFYHNYTEEHAAWDEPFEDRLIPEVMLPDGERVALLDPIYVDDLGTGWLKYTCNLDKFKNYPYIRIAMHGITANEQNIYVDHIQVTNLISNDLAVYAFTGNTKVEAGKAGAYKFTIFNRGAEDVKQGEYSVKLYDGNDVVETIPGRSIAAKDYLSYDFSRTYPVEAENTTRRLRAEIVYAKDEVPGNNVSDVLYTAITPVVLPEVGSLQAAAEDNNVLLSWGKPDARNVEDGFEDHTPFETQNFAGYRMIDGDGNNTWSFSSIYFDHTGDPQPFMVFNPVALGIVDYASTLFPYDSFDPHSGNQVLACFQGYKVNDSGEAVSAKNDDWFISPEVFGGQTISFYAKSGDFMQGIDKFEVMYSSSDTSTSSFRPLSDVVSTGKDWTLYEYTLPESAKYFAIHCVSEDGFILFIDDLNFRERRVESPFAHTGYRLYRDGVMLGEFPAATTSFADNALAKGIYRYHVTALYENGRESGKSNIVDVQIGESGVESVRNVANLSVEKGMIKVAAASEEAVAVITADGKRIYSATGTDHSVEVAPGVYIVTIGRDSHRVIVK